MSNAIERFLDDLALEASKKLPAGEGIRLLDEVRVHLDEELCSRLEFGETPEQAARQAVLAFGSPTELVNGIRSLNLPAQGTWHSRPFLIASTLGTLLSSLIVSSAAAADSSSDWLGYLLFVDFVVFGALLMITAWHAKRIQFISLAVCFALAVLAAGVFGAHENVYTDANPWGMPRHTVASWISDLEHNRAKMREEIARFDVAYEKFL